MYKEYLHMQILEEAKFFQYTNSRVYIPTTTVLQCVPCGIYCSRQHAQL